MHLSLTGLLVGNVDNAHSSLVVRSIDDVLLSVDWLTAVKTVLMTRSRRSSRSSVRKNMVPARDMKLTIDVSDSDTAPEEAIQ